MKINYYYDGQFRRLLKHLIRVFGEFQVRNGVDEDGKPKYKSVPARYADISRLAAYIIAGNSENVMPSTPMITINVQSLKFDRPNLRAPASHTTVMGTNKSPAENEYVDELDKQYQITRYNPTPWKLTFNVNIWTTTLTNKMELFEQIATLFNPSVTLQMSENPLDWTSAVDVELTDCQFSTRGFPQGTDTDLDIMVLTFECPIWLSLPANVKQAKLIQQIVTNINTAKDEFEIDLENYTDAITDVYTPKNMCILVDRIDNTNNSETYVLTLVSSSLNPLSSNGKIYSWDRYLKYLDPDFEDKDLYIKFQQGIEETNPIRGDVIQRATTDEPNKMVVQVDTSSYIVDYAIQSFVTESTQLLNALPEQMFINIAEHDIEYKGTTIKPNGLFKIENDKATIIDLDTVSNYIYNSDDTHFYKYNEVVGWHQSVMNKYRQGYWRIAFKSV
ncbi:tail sheath [Cronobacter phage vB_CsaM_GAP32]|uniref:Tail sheath stabilizer and completion protein n=1 Tax=Cronobacter phage vB_CsaM_GAP32 TaxID=1141136 RepID=K4F7G1_9CAUD|nr:tail sheath [Cronobacter phage vB_CsaM_GAP32]AFC21677.1 tail sheath stabilizer and completion protein [Cronobacter phage vB_CsaM_GAP32]